MIRIGLLVPTVASSCPTHENDYFVARRSAVKKNRGALQNAPGI